MNFVDYYLGSFALMFLGIMLLPVKRAGSLGHVFVAITLSAFLGWAMWWVTGIVLLVTRLFPRR